MKDMTTKPRKDDRDAMCLYKICDQYRIKKKGKKGEVIQRILGRVELAQSRNGKLQIMADAMNNRTLTQLTWETDCMLSAIVVIELEIDDVVCVVETCDCQYLHCFSTNRRR